MFVCEDRGPLNGSDTSGKFLREKQAERIVLNAVTRATAAHRVVSDSPNASNYVGRFAKDAGLVELGITPNQLRQAVARLQADGKIEVAQMGTYTNRSPKFGLRIREHGL